MERGYYGSLQLPLFLGIFLVRVLGNAHCMAIPSGALEIWNLSRKIWLQYYTAYCSLICLKHNALEELVQSIFEDGYRFGLQVVQFLVDFRGRTSGVTLYMSFLC